MRINLKKLLSRDFRERVMYGLFFLPDAPYIQLFYRTVTGRHLNLNNPQGYNEKLNWLKLHDKHPEYSGLADKLKVRAHIEKELGAEYLFPLLGAWRRFEDIEFDKLPNEFVLKCNHDSGSVRIIKDKTKLTEKDYIDLRRHFNKHLRRDFFYAGREYSYKGITPYVLAEKMMHTADGSTDGINDYKFFCFNGEPKLLLLCSGRDTEKQIHYEDYFDMDFNWLHIRNGWTESPKCPEKPECFEELKNMARKLSTGIRQVRMDFYEIDGKPYFGEYTFFSGGGFELFEPEEWEQKLGSWIELDDLR